MARPIFALVLVVASFVTLVPRARACSCMAMTPEEALAAAAAVFEGTVFAIEPVEGQGFRVRLRVTQTWKGADAEVVEVLTPTDSAGCGFPFREHEGYLVYAHVATDESGRPIEPAALRVSLCSRTRAAAEANEDRTFLGVGTTPVDVPAAPPSAERSSPPPRGGCASCAVGARDDAPLALAPALASLALALALGYRSRRASRCRRAIAASS